MRAAVALGLVLLTVVAVLAFAQPPSGGGPPPGGPPGAGPGARPGGGFAPPPFPGDTMAVERDSLMNEVIKSIAGKEQMPAESVFKDIQAFKGRPAGSIPRLMNFGFGRSLGVSCYHCHARNDWAKDEKKQKRIAREMVKMVTAINNDYLWKIEGLGDPQAQSPAMGAPGGAGGPGRPTVNCGTCHRGSIHANPDAPRPGGPSRGGPGR